jgi:hypothetical protein
MSFEMLKPVMKGSGMLENHRAVLLQFPFKWCPHLAWLPAVRNALLADSTQHEAAQVV